MIRPALLLLLLMAPASSQEFDRAKVRQLFQLANAHYTLGQYVEALEAFQQAYLLHPDPAFLYNIGQCDRQLGHSADAARDYRAFLRALPVAPNRTAVEQLIVEMDNQAAAQIRLVQAQAPPRQELPPPLAPAPAKRVDRLAIALVTSGAVLLAGGLGLALYGASLDTDARDPRAHTDLATREQLYAESRSEGSVGYVLIGAGCALAAVGILKWVLQPRDARVAALARLQVTF